ncbi:MAG: hypothetical protein DRI24_08345 [Deltaproteobacteria bacterium]|nr:MAG: hypothetical protein DRI24_08345 [Deltaproteobacteria bacterium]
MKKSVSRVVADKSFSYISKNSNINTFDAAGHKVLKMKIMEIPVTPKMPKIPKAEHRLNGIFIDKTLYAHWWHSRKKTETVHISTFRPPLCKGKNILKTLYRQVKGELLQELGRTLPDQLPLNEVVTLHVKSGTICTWKRASFHNYENKSVYRLVLHELNSVLADTIPKVQKRNVAEGMMAKYCLMTKIKDVYRCVY